MTKTKEKLNTIKEEKATNKMFVELTDDELTQVLGGVMMQHDENANETPGLYTLRQRAGKLLDIVE